MALVFMDSFDHYATNDILKKWDYLGGYIYGKTEINQSAQRRSTTKYLRLYDHWVEKDIVDTVTGLDIYTCIVGAACCLWTSSGTWVQLDLKNAAGDTQIKLFASNDGKLKIYRGSTLLEETPQDYVDMNTWFHIEIKVVIHATNGSYEVRLNEVNVLSNSGINTQAVPGEGIAKVRWTGGDFLVGSACVDDFFLFDGNSPNNDFIGDCRVDCIYPDSPGFYTDLTPNTGANWENVDDPEVSPAIGGDIDDDATYNESEDVGDIDTYNHDSIIALGTTIFAAAQNSCVRKTDAGKRYIKQILRQGGSNYLRDEEYKLTDFYKVTQRPLDVNPHTSNVWTESDLNAVESGIKITT